MNKDKIILLGAGGQLGKDLVRSLSTLGELKTMTREDADFNSPSNLYDALVKVSKSFKPSVVVNAAAYTNVDQSEINISDASLVNAFSPRVIAEFSEMVGAIMVHYSTDYVFNGSGVHFWSESDAVDPLSIYGSTKYEGECEVQKACKRHLIIRTSWIMSSHGSNFISTILALAAKQESLKVVNDQIGAPTSTALLSQITATVLRTMMRVPFDDERWGIYHVSGAGETSWCEYAKYIVEGATLRGGMVKLKSEAVIPVPSSEYKQLARRPLNSRLNLTKIKKNFAVEIPKWQQLVDNVLDEIYVRGANE